MLQRLYDVLDDSDLQCSYEEKLEVLEIVKKIHTISCLERREGLWALEDVAAEQEDTFFKRCLLLLVEGTTQEELEEYASIRILADKPGGKRLLEIAVIVEGILRIRQSQSPDRIFHRLGAWFGSEFAETFDLTLQGLFAVFFDSRLRCSYEERLEVLETVKKIFKIVFFARRNGILALEDVAAEQEDMFFKSCLLLLVEAASTEEIEEYASIWMLVDNAQGKRLLEMAVLADGVVQIQKGEGPNMIFRCLGAWFGSEFAEKFESARQEMKVPQD